MSDHRSNGSNGSRGSSDGKDREKKSWREIDARREKPRDAGSSSLHARLQDEQKSKHYRAALDALFQKGGFDKVARALGREDPTPESTPPLTADSPPPPPEGTAGAATAKTAKTSKEAKPPTETEARFAARKKILEAVGRDEISRAIDRYLARWPLPEDWEVLEQALEHSDETKVGAALDRLGALLAREKPRRARTLVAKLRYLEDTARDLDVQGRAGEVRRRLA